MQHDEPYRADSSARVAPSEPQWWTPPERRDPRDAIILARQRERDEQDRAQRLASIGGPAVCPSCRRSL